MSFIPILESFSKRSTDFPTRAAVIVTPPVPPLSQIKEVVLEDWTKDKQEEINEEFYEALKAYYTIVIEDDNVSVLDEAN